MIKAKTVKKGLVSQV